MGAVDFGSEFLGFVEEGVAAGEQLAKSHRWPKHLMLLKDSPL